MAPAAFRRHRERGGESPPFFFFFLDLPPRWEKGFPSGPWLPWRRRGGSHSEIGSLSLCFLLFLRSQILPFHCFLNSRRSVTPIGLKFSQDFYPNISFLAPEEGHQPPYRVTTRTRGAPYPLGRILRPCGPLGHRVALILFPKNHIYSKKISVNFYRVWTPFDIDFL